MTAFVAIILIAAAVTGFALYKRPVKKVQLPNDYEQLLVKHVNFYRGLAESDKRRFVEKIREFLGYIRIHGVGTQVDDLDRLLVAASGVIPVFGFPEWRYYNLKDVLLYPNTFNEDDFSTSGKGRDVLGMVGSGPLQRMMILSKPALHQGFDDSSGRENAGIHEFVHLLDKEDGVVDGLPEALLKRQYAIPWLKFMAENMVAMKAGKSDINIYGSKNEAEFLAVAAEYFFTQPGLFKRNHSDLYDMMTEIFHQHPPR
jgi:Mlc titration factor MtfA (ptsG expression regulator)